MSNPFLEFEQKYGVSATQVAALLGYPRPTYYQYRRGQGVPTSARRYLEIMNTVPKATVFELLAKFTGEPSSESD